MLSRKSYRKAANREGGGLRNVASLSCLAPLLLVCSSSLRAAEPSPEISSLTYAVGSGLGARIVNGLPTTWYPSVGALLYGKSNIFGSWCTATLIGCNTVLTAAHCVAEDEDIRNYRMFFQHGGMVKIESIDWQKQDYREPTTNGEQADIAVITLAQPITASRQTPSTMIASMRQTCQAPLSALAAPAERQATTD